MGYRELNLMKGRVGAEKKREEKRESNEESHNFAVKKSSRSVEVNSGARANGGGAH